jgi:hypothetical protein
VLEYDTPEKLRNFLVDLHKKGQLPTSMGKIARNKIEATHGFTQRCLSNRFGLAKWAWAKKIVDEFEQELIESEGISAGKSTSKYGTPARFKQLIEELKESMDVPFNGGTIPRTVFEKKHGLPTGSLQKSNISSEWQWARDLLEELEKELYEEGVIGTAWERKVPDIRLHLESLHATNSLPVNKGGRLNRLAVLSEFGFSSCGSSFLAEKRAPKLKDLFVEFDQIIEDGNYSRHSGDIYEDKLKAVLGRDDIVLFKSHRTISRTWLTEQVGIPASLMYSTPSLVALIDAKHKEIHETQKRGQTKKAFTLYGAVTINLGATPYSETHSRVFSFECLIDKYGLEFAEKIGTAFIAISKKQASPGHYYSRILHFFGWLADEPNNALDVVKNLAAGKKVAQVRFERVCLEYQQDVYAEKKGRRGAAASRHSMPPMSSITVLGEAKVLPLFHFRRRRNGAKKDRTNRPSILEAKRKTEAEKVAAILVDAAKYRNIDIEHGKDTKTFIETLMYERERRDELSDDLVEAMLEISCDRLEELRIQASSVFNAWKSKHKKGSELIKNATHSGSKIAQLLEDAGEGKLPESRTSLVSRLFPLYDKEQTLSNIVALVDAKYNGFCPTCSTTGDQFWSRQYQKVGGIKEASSYLLPTRIAVSAALTLYLCEGGNNNAVALVLAPDCVRDSEVPAHKKVVSRKDRSKGKTIYDDLPIKSNNSAIVSAVSALEYLIESIERITKNQKKTEQYIALYSAKGTALRLTGHNFRADFKTIVNRSEYLRDLHLVPSMIRPTVLLEIQLKNPSNLGIAQMMAQHESGTTTTGYTNKLPYRVIQEEHILGYQNSLEIVMAQNVENPHVKIGVSASKWAKRLEHAQRTGLGVFCEDRELDDGKGNKTKCTEIENCAKCKHDRMLISADTRSIAEMIVWREALDNHEPEWVSERLDRWSSVWVPWQALFSVVLDEKMARGRLSMVKNDALEYVSTLKKQDEFTMPEPW